MSRARFRSLELALLTALLCVSPALAQETLYSIAGTVVDADTGEPLPGANVRIEEAAFGAATDLNGAFELSARLAPGPYTLVATFIGYGSAERALSLGADASLDVGAIELTADVLGVDEIVVTGTAGPTARRQLGNAIGTVSARDIELSDASAIDQALAGKIAGAVVQQNSGNPAGGISIRLRGTSTVLGGADPLYIVDGVIVNNDSPLLIDLGGGSVDASTGAQNRLVDINPNDIERIEVVKGAAAAALYGSRANNGVVQIFTKRGQSGVPRVTFSTSARTSAIRKTLDVNTFPFDADGNPVERFDWQDDIFQRAYGTEQYASVAGGSQGTRYFVSGSHFANEGIVRGNLFRRLNGRLRLDQTLTDWASLSVGGSFTQSTSDDVPNGGITANYGALTGFIFGPNTSDIQPDELGNYPNPILSNPLEVIERFEFEQETRRFIGDVQLGLLPMRGLSIDYTLGLDTYEQEATAFIPPNATANDLARRGVFENLQVNNDLTARYETTLTPGVRSTTQAGGTLQYREFSSLIGQSTTLTPFVETVEGGSLPVPTGDIRSALALYGIFLQETLGINDRIFLTGAARLDASSVFGPDERWQFYPKVSASYLVSEESFWRESALSVVSLAKLRASLGYSGGLTAIGPFDRFTTYGPSGYLGLNGLGPSSQLGALDVKPERQREIEFGLDLGFFENRYGLEFTYYNQRTEDLLLERSLAPTSGFLTRLQNVGTLDNRGVEILARALPINRRNFRWNTSITFAANENEVNGLEEDILILGGFGFVAAINGQPLGVFYADAFERTNDDGDIFLEASDGDVVLDEGGLPVEFSGTDLRGNATNRKIVGDPNPDWTASWINEFELFENLLLRFQLDAVVGQDVFNFTRRLAALPAFGTLTDYQQELEGDLPEGYNARTFGIFEPWVEDGTFVKLRELTVAYTLYPRQLPVQSVRLSLTGRNLFSIDDYSGYDPEVNVSGQSTVVRNFDFVEVPIPRTFAFGVTVNL